MFRTIHTRLTGGAMRWLAIPLLAVMAAAAAVSGVASTNTVQTAFGISTAERTCSTLHLACTKRTKVTVNVLYPNTLRRVQMPIKLGPAQAISPLTPGQQARMAKLRAQMQSTIVVH